MLNNRSFHNISYIFLKYPNAFLAHKCPNLLQPILDHRRNMLRNMETIEQEENLTEIFKHSEKSGAEQPYVYRNGIENLL